MIQQFEATEWSAVDLIQDSIHSVLAEQGQCSVMLTGGRSAKRLYQAWNSLAGFQQVTDVQFYFGDERCVPTDHAESIYGMVMQNLFLHGVPTGCTVLRMEADASDRWAAAQRYEDILPVFIDILLLGVGDDGHIASLFPYSAALQERQRQVIPVTGPKPPFDRLTITPQVIMKARSIFVLAFGPAKAEVLLKVLNLPTNFNNMPACLVQNATWFLNTA